MGEKKMNSWKVLGLAAAIMMAVAGTWHGVNSMVTGSKPVEIPGDGGRGAEPSPKTPAELFAERMDAADKLIVKPTANWTESERRAESNLYVWVKQCGDRKLPWYYGDDDVAYQRQRICRIWSEMLEKRADEIAAAIKKVDGKCADANVEREWAVRSHSFATNECARMELLLDEVAYPLMNVTTNALVRRYGYRTLSKGATGVSGKLGAWAMDNYTKVVSGVHVFTNRQQVAEYVDQLKQDGLKKSAEIRRSEALTSNLAVRLKEAQSLAEEASINVEAAKKLMKDESSQSLKEQFASWRRWVLKSVLILGE